MIAVTDTSPICYLVLIGEIDILPKLYSEVRTPAPVIAELLHEDAPGAVRAWAATLPAWISVQEDPRGAIVGMEKLQAGERAAIQLAESIPADILFLDEKSARRVAADQGLRNTGTLGVLGEAAGRGLVDLAAAIEPIWQTVSQCCALRGSGRNVIIGRHAANPRRERRPRPDQVGAASPYRRPAAGAGARRRPGRE